MKCDGKGHDRTSEAALDEAFIAPSRMVGYIREGGVGSSAGGIEAQRAVLIAAGVPAENIHVDVCGKRNAALPGREALFGDPSRRRRGDPRRGGDLGRGDVLVVCQVTRLGRDDTDLLEAVEELQERGCHLVAIADGIDTRTPSGRSVFDVMLHMARWRRELWAERMSTASADAAARGKQKGRPPKVSKEQVSGLLRRYHGGEDITDLAKEVGLSVIQLHRHFDAVEEKPRRWASVLTRR